MRFLWARTPFSTSSSLFGLRSYSDFLFLLSANPNYVDTRGQSEIGFAFCSLLGFQLLPRLKNLHAQKLYRPETGHPDAYPNLQPILTRAIKWDLIRQQYDEMIKCATALRLGTAETEAILRRFTRGGVQHPT